MKRFFKITGYLIGLLLLVLFCFVIYVQLHGIPTYEPQAVMLKVDVTEERIGNGMRIATMQCIQCHANQENILTGRYLKELPKEFGKIYSRNITHDTITGIGKWTDGDLYSFLRTGIRADGSYSPPYMPKFPLMADEDLKDIIAWLRSDSFGLVANQSEPPESEPSLLIKVLTNTIIKPRSFNEQPIGRPDTLDMIKLGEYYANGVAGCFNCHSADLTKVNDLNPSESKGYYGGGSVFTDTEGNPVVSKNITFDQTGIAHYSEEDFIKAVKFGQKPDGTSFRYPMVPHMALTTREVKSIYAFLKTVPPIKNQIP